jgi:hypothetical protein
MPITINGTGTITGVSSTGISSAQDLPATGSMTTLGVTGDLSFNSGYGSSAVVYGCRAWINFNGLSTPAIRASGNVSSITDNGTGDYTVNFTTAMPNANYAPTLGLDPTGGAQIATSFVYVKARATTSVRLQSWYGTGGAPHDIQEIDCAVFR